MAIPGIQEIQALATKYSKVQLQRMAQMGLVDPTKAVMAGMMIDRIEKQNAQPPQTTVAEDVMAAPQMAPQMGAPQQGAAPPPGVAGLPSGLPQQMAGGGIVAFADGGDAHDYAGGGMVAFAGGGDSRNDPAMRIDPKVQAKRDTDRYQILSDELRDAERRAAAGDQRALQDAEAIRREMRSIKPAPSAATGVAALLPSAEAAPVSRGIAPPTPTSAAAPTGDYYQDPFGAPDYTTDGSAFEGLKETVEPGKPFEPSFQGQIFGYKYGKLPPVAPPKPAAPKAEAAPPTTFEPKTEAPAPEAKPEMGPREPSFIDRLRGIQMDVPEEKTLETAISEQEAADTAMGVDKNLFENLRADYATTKGKFQDRADKAAAQSLLMFGLGLMGGRRGQEFQNATRSGQQALLMYMDSMDGITKNQDKLDQSMRELAIAENEYKRTRSDKALARVEKNKEKIDAINLENTKLRAQTEIKAAEFALDKVKNENPALWQTFNKIAEEQRAKGNKNYTTLDALRDYQGTQKSGELNRGALFALWSKMDPAEKFAYKNDFEQFVRQYQGGGVGAGGGGKGVKFLGYE